MLQTSSVVCLSVGLSVTAMSPAKTAKPIEMPFGLWAGVGSRNHVLTEGPDPHGKEQFLGERTCPDIPDDSLP